MSISMRTGASRLRSAALLRRSPVAAAVALAMCAAPLPAAETEGALELEEVTVTGTRIRAVTGMDTPTPVTAVAVDEIVAMSPVSVTEALVQLPQFAASATAENFGGPANNFFSSPGGGSLNLRGVGSSRTLTLLDGRRMPPASIFGGPDINTFPDQMLRRIETVTGGASAAYGTDAVSGVVNYILDTDFQGIRASAQFGQSDRGDGANQRYSFSLGHALTEKLHLLFSAGYMKQDAINSADGRDWYQSCGLIRSSAAGAGSSPDNPALVPACNLRDVRSSVDGVMSVEGLGRITFDAAGNPVPFSPGVVQAGTWQAGGSGEDLGEVLNVLLPGQNRKNAFAYLDYDVSDSLNVYAQGMYSKQLLSRAYLSGNYGGVPLPLHLFTIYADNAFLPDSLREYMQDNGIASATLGRQLSPYDGVLGGYRNHTKTSAGTLGFKSTVGRGWSLDGYVQFGKTELDAEQSGGSRQDRIFLAVDAVRDENGVIRCRIDVVSPGLVDNCQPLNLFGRGNGSAAAFDWVTGFDPNVPVTVNPYVASDGAIADWSYSYVGDEAKHRLVTLKQTVAELSASGELVQGWAGPIVAAVGAHYRKESLGQRVQASQGNPAANPAWYPVFCNDPGFGPQCPAGALAVQVNSGYRPPGTIGVRGVPAGVANNLVEIQFSNVPFIQGEYDVKELFAETVVPLVSGAAWMRSLNFQGAIRWADYEGSGTIWSWKGGLDGQVTDQLRLRGTYSRDTRAGNMAERFDRTGGAANAVDRKQPGPGDPPIPDPANYGFTIVSGGNPNIKPETGDTITVGLVYRPAWMNGLSMSVDWLKVSLKDAIEALGVQDIIDLCYQQDDQDQCSRITREVGADGIDRIIFVNSARQNLGKSTYEGIDFELAWARRVTLLGGDERLSARLFGTYLIESSTTNYAGVKTETTGQVVSQNPRRRANLNLGYNRNGFGWTLIGRYHGGGRNSIALNREDANGTVATWNVADNHTGSSVYWDTRLFWRFNMGGGEVEVFGNVQNLFDRDPPWISTLEGVGQTAGGFDLIGRRYVAGINLRF
jgi:iron complex outermembrane receptor protein